MRFIEFLLEQVNVTLDPEDPAGSLARAKDQMKTSMRNPQRAIKQRQQNIDARDEEIAQEEDPDIAKIKTDIQRDEERTARKNMNLAAVQKKRNAEKEREMARIV